jgi:IS30 family transposase
MSQIKYITKRKKFKHLTKEERKIIERMLREKVPISKIAKYLGRSESTIRREIARGTVTKEKQNPYFSKNPKYPDFIYYECYMYDIGQKNYDKNRAKCKYSGKMLECLKLISFVEDNILKNKWSPDAAIGYALVNNLFPKQSITTKTFYNLVERNLLKVKNSSLLRKVSMKNRKRSDISSVNKRKLGKSIDERDNSIESREEFSHWEGDLIVGKEHKSYFFSLVERKIRFGFLFKINSKESQNIVDVIDELEKEYPNFNSIFKSITFDNGTEFSKSSEIERNNRINIYYAHPYSSFERGTNENWNGIVRRYLPKGSDFSNLTDKDIEKICNNINSMPRKILGYKTPIELWEKEINAIKIA